MANGWRTVVYRPHYRIKSRINGGGQTNVNHVGSTTIDPAHCVAVAVPSGITRNLLVKAEITNGSALVAFRNSSPSSEWIHNIPITGPDVYSSHDEALQVNSGSGQASISIVEVKRPDGFGKHISHLESIDLDIQVN
jgi:hypothetical protein